MPDYIEPTQEQFETAEAVALDVLSTSSPNVMIRAGSVVRELIVRPLSYLYAWAVANLDNLRTKSSVAYLKTSTATENELADAVASNYFITRSEGSYSRGVITLTVTTPFARVPGGTDFSAGGYDLQVTQTCVLTSADIPDEQDNITYIKMFSYLSEDGEPLYLANVPVQTTETGKIEIPEGTEVSVLFANAFIREAELTSAVTGGANTETDAEMMLRCEYNTAASGIGSYNGLRKKLDNAPVPVTGLSVVAGEDAPMFRARYNNTNINPGGYVDAYVKLQKQESVRAVTIALDPEDSSTDPETNMTTYTFTVPSTACPGFYGVRRLVSTHGDVQTYTVEYASADPSMSADGARLSRHQSATLSFSSAYDDNESVTVYLSCMPDVDVVQDYLDMDSNRFIGQDVCAKAAVPVKVGITVSVHSEDELEDSEFSVLRTALSDYVNSLPVGTKSINFSDLRKICADALPKADLRLPCNMSASCYLKDGTRDQYYSNTGILSIADPVNSAFWDYRVCFFSLTEDSIRIEQA